MKNSFDLTGMRAIVTGAAGGLSLGMAEGLHEFGAELVIIDVKDEGAQTASRLGGKQRASTLCESRSEQPR